MPKISSNRDHFFKLLGKELSEQQLEDLTFAFGIEAEEYDEVESGQNVKKISFEIAANRPDLLCIESLSKALRLYIGENQAQNQYKTVQGTEKIYVKAATSQIRPYVVAAILRNVELDPNSYQSFIDFQDKLHQNYCRKRTLVSIGTHDLDTIKGPFYYLALPPQDIVFKALKQTEELNGVQLFEKLENDQYLKHYLHIIKNSPVYPVILDSNNVVLSLPPIINGDHSKMSHLTKNILIEVTATDHHRAQNTLLCIVNSFAQYTQTHEIETVEIVYEESGKSIVTPIFNERQVVTNLKYINSILGIDISIEQSIQLLKKMGVHSEAIDAQQLSVTVPYYRTDILQECDIAEDIGIAYGYNNIEFKIPEAATTGGEFLLNKLSDMVREEVALCGFVECLNFVLCQNREITELLNKTQNNLKVGIQNSKSDLFQCARTTLMAGILKTLKTNQRSKLPVQLFEVADVVHKGQKGNEIEGIVGAFNRRYLCAIHSDNDSSGLEIIHGLLDQLMVKLKVSQENYSLQKSNDETFFPGLQANIIYKGQVIGIMGVVHPLVLNNIEWPFPAAMIELDVQTLLEDF